MTAGRRRSGFTLIELMIVIAIVGILAALATVKYLAYIERVRVARAILDVKALQTEIDSTMFEGGAPPTTLAALNLERNDPWGFPYRYLALRDARGGKINQRQARKDRFLVPLNDDYDLYSVGADGRSTIAISTPQSADDVVRANDGAFIGLAVHY